MLDNGYEPIEGYDVNDVGWMRVDFCDAGLPGFVAMGENGTWDDYYERPPRICFHISGSILDECHPDTRNGKDQIS